MPDINQNADRDLALKTLERKAPLLRLLSEAPDKLATVSVVSQWVWDVDAIVRSQLSLIEAQAAEISRLRLSLERVRERALDGVSHGLRADMICEEISEAIEVVLDEERARTALEANHGRS